MVRTFLEDRLLQRELDGYREYAKRLPPECALHLIEIPAGKRGKNADVARILRDETAIGSVFDLIDTAGR